MKLHLLFTLVFTAVLSLIQCTSNITGNTSETGNASVVATLYNSDGSAASGVHVHIRPRSTLAKTPLVLSKTSANADSTITDSNGKFTFDSTLDTGTYVIEAVSGNNAVLIDSVKITNPDSTKVLPSARLKPTGIIKGIITLSEGDDPRKVFILAFGIDRFATVKEDGSFLFEDLAEARYDLRIICSLDDYETLDTTGIIVTSGQTTDLDTINLPFTGISTPKNLTLSYDTMRQIVTLKWSSSNSNVKSYNIYRRNTGLNTLYERINTSPVTDTVFEEQMEWTDSVYEYTIAAVSPANMEGIKSAEVMVKVTSAYKVADTLFTTDGQIYSMTTDKNGNFIAYVRKNTRTISDSSYYKVERYGKEGNILNSWDIPMLMFEDYDFSNIQKIAADDSNYIYVAFLRSLLKLDSSGTLIKQIPLQNEIAALSVFNDTIYVGDKINHTVYAFSTDGDSLFSWGGKGFTDGHFEYIDAITCDSSGLIYVEDYKDTRRVQVFNHTGTFIRSIDCGKLNAKLSSVNDSLLLFTGQTIYCTDLNGTIRFSLSTLSLIDSPIRIHFDNTGNLVAASMSGDVVSLKRN